MHGEHRVSMACLAGRAVCGVSTRCQVVTQPAELPCCRSSGHSESCSCNALKGRKCPTVDSSASRCTYLRSSEGVFLPRVPCSESCSLRLTQSAAGRKGYWTRHGASQAQAGGSPIASDMTVQDIAIDWANPCIIGPMNGELTVNQAGNRHICRGFHRPLNKSVC